jgi:hypothetical protein
MKDTFATIAPDTTHDSNLRVLNSPMTSHRHDTGYQFDTESDRGEVKSVHIKNASIDEAKIKSFNFNQGTGGTLTLGGTANGNGVLMVKNSSGSAIVTANNTGLSINNGNFIFTNNSGGTVIDSAGLVSTNTFQFSQVFNGNTDQTFSGTTFADVSGGALTAFVLTRTTNVYTYLMAYGRACDIYVPTNEYLEMRILDNFNTTSLKNVLTSGKLLTIPDYVGSVSTYYLNNDMVFNASFNSLAAGTHTLKLQVHSSENAGSVNIGAFQIGYIIYGN